MYTHLYICEYFYKYIHTLCECVCMFGREKLERESWEGGKDLEKEGVVTDTCDIREGREPVRGCRDIVKTVGEETELEQIQWSILWMP